VSFSAFFLLFYRYSLTLQNCLRQAEKFIFFNSFPAELNKINGFYTCNSALILKNLKMR